MRDHPLIDHLIQPSAFERGAAEARADAERNREALARMQSQTADALRKHFGTE